MRILSFDSKKNILKAELPGFTCYEVFDVSPETFTAMQSANSPQKYFSEHIWGNKFEHDSHWPDLEAVLEYMEKNLFCDAPVTVWSTRGDGDTPLHVACVWGDLSAIKLLLGGGANVNAKGDLATTPIFNAVSNSRVRSVALLLAAGATVDDLNGLSITARQLAHWNKIEFELPN